MKRNQVAVKLAEKIFNEDKNKDLIYLAIFNPNVEIEKETLHTLQEILTQVYLKNNDPEISFLVDSISTLRKRRGKKYLSSSDLLDVPIEFKEKASRIENLGLNDQQVIDVIEKILTIITVVSLMDDGRKVVSGVNKILTGKFENLYDILDTFDNVNSTLTGLLLKYKNVDDGEISFSGAEILENFKQFKREEEKVLYLNSLPFMDQHNLVQSGKMLLLAAPTNHGKTTMMVSVLTGIYKDLCYNEETIREKLGLDEDFKLAVIFLSLEETKHSIQKRVLANLLDIPLSNLKEMTVEAIDQRIKELKEKEPYLDKESVKMFIKYEPAVITRVSDLALYLEKLKRKKVYPVAVVVDYLDKISTSIIKSGEYRHQLMGAAMELRNLSIKNNFALITATQLNRESISSEKNKRALGLDKMAEAFSKSWETDAIVLFRKLENVKDPKDSEINYLEALIPKSRDSAGRHTPFVIDAKYSRSKVLGNIVSNDVEEFKKAFNSNSGAEIEEELPLSSEEIDLDAFL